MTSTPSTELGLGEVSAKIGTINLTNCTETTSNGYRGATCTYSGTLPMGYYNVELTSSWHNATYTLTNGLRIRDYRTMSNITYMQDMNSDICENTPEATTTGANIITLKDSRDQKSYKVARLADGNCWMVSNLALDGNRTLHPSDSNVTIDRPLAANIANGTVSNDTNVQIFSGVANNYTTSCSYPYCVTSTEKYGNLYNFMAATAGVGTASSMGTITESVCPSAANGETWRLPDYGTTIGLKSYSNLADAYGLPTTNVVNGAAVQAIQRSPLSFPLAGDYERSAVAYQARFAHYWSRSIASNSVGSAYFLYFRSDSGYFYPLHADAKSFGFSVRCVFGE